MTRDYSNLDDYGIEEYDDMSDALSQGSEELKELYDQEADNIDKMPKTTFSKGFRVGHKIGYIEGLLLAGLALVSVALGLRVRNKDTYIL